MKDRPLTSLALAAVVSVCLVACEGTIGGGLSAEAGFDASLDSGGGPADGGGTTAGDSGSVGGGDAGSSTTGSGDGGGSSTGVGSNGDLDASQGDGSLNDGGDAGPDAADASGDGGDAGPDAADASGDGGDSGSSTGDAGGNTGDSGGPGSDFRDPVDLPSSRPANATCLAVEPPTLGTVTAEAAFPGVSFGDIPDITGMKPSPDGQAWYVAIRDGRILRFPNRSDADGGDVREVLNIAGRVSQALERGLLGFALSPDFASDGAMFVSYTTATHSRVSRFESEDGGLSFADGTADERVVLELRQEADNHNGGDLHFMPDGTLLLSLGDDNDGDLAQDLSDPRGSILRIDPFRDDGLPTGEVISVRDYGIPADNPFASGAGALPEIYAYGFRNPWRIAVDPVTSDVWAGDVGEGAWEEVDLVVPGGNHGWPYKEGSHCYRVNPCDDASWVDPVAEYSHDLGVSVIAAGVYRGSEIPGLYGSFVFSEWLSGQVWATRVDPDTGEGTMTTLGFVESTVAWGQDAEGELYAAVEGFPQLVPAAGGGGTSFPQKLSETGCVNPGDPTEPAVGLIPYDVNVELWADDATKYRWMAIPDGSTIAVSSDGHWELPVGSVLVKEFWVDGVRAETRLMMRHADGSWAGYPYRWDADGQDATLVLAGSTVDTGSRLWSVPSAAQCLQCHTAPAGRTLGPETAQLNRSFPGATASPNQIEAFADLGLLSVDPGDASGLDRHPLLNGSASAERRARSYLHVQCAHCHRPGTADQGLDLRWQTSFAGTGLCNTLPQSGDLGVSGARIVTPGDADASVLMLRMQSLDPNLRMPRIGTVRAHPAGVGVVRSWIDALSGCP